MKTAQAFIGARGIDSEPYSHTGEQVKAKALKDSGIDFVVLYLGAVTPGIVANVVGAGLGFMPCTYADQFDGSTTVARLTALQLPKGCTVWLDVEGERICPPQIEPLLLQAKINAWASAVIDAGYIAGLYVGAPQPLTSAELYALKVTRYWKSASRILDRNGQLAEPACGWCMFQSYPSRDWAGVWSDVDFIHQDYRQRLPSWVVA